MENPWLKLPNRPPYILEVDKDVIEIFNAKILTSKAKNKDDYFIQTEMLPEPFGGRPDGKILFLNLNPGFDIDNDLNTHRNNSVFTGFLKKKLSRSIYDVTTFYKSVEVQSTPYYKWYSDRTKTLRELYAWDFTNHFQFVEYHGYHSRRFKDIPKLPSQEYGFAVVREFIKNNDADKSIIFILRGERKWKEAVPELNSLNNVFKFNSNQSLFVTENNMPSEAWKKLNTILRISK